jgi:hypothetical protein
MNADLRRRRVRARERRYARILVVSYPDVYSMCGHGPISLYEKTTGKENQTVCLYGTRDDDYFPPTEKGNILHEFGHVLGLAPNTFPLI